MGQGFGELEADGETQREFKVKSSRFKVKAARKPKTRRECEDRADAKAARKALAESDERIPYEKVRKELGLGVRPLESSV